MVPTSAPLYCHVLTIATEVKSDYKSREQNNAIGTSNRCMVTLNITRKFVVQDLNGLHCTVVCMVFRIQFVSETINIVSDNK